jgi:hypothetical protein
VQLPRNSPTRRLSRRRLLSGDRREDDPDEDDVRPDPDTGACGGGQLASVTDAPIQPTTEPPSAAAIKEGAGATEADTTTPASSTTAVPPVPVRVLAPEPAKPEDADDLPALFGTDWLPGWSRTVVGISGMAAMSMVNLARGLRALLTKRVMTLLVIVLTPADDKLVEEILKLPDKM